MFYRDFKYQDLAQIIALKQLFYKDEFPLVNPMRNTIASLVVEDQDRIIASGTVKLFADASMIVNQDLPVRQKALILDLLTKHAIIETKAYGLEVLNIFSKREDFLDVLKKHYGFADNYKAISLTLEG